MYFFFSNNRLDVIDQGEHGPDGGLKIALIQLISFIDPLNENNDQSNSKTIKQGVESRRIITDRISLRDGTLPNIVSLGKKDNYCYCIVLPLSDYYCLTFLYMNFTHIYIFFQKYFFLISFQ